MVGFGYGFVAVLWWVLAAVCAVGFFLFYLFIFWWLGVEVEVVVGGGGCGCGCGQWSQWVLAVAVGLLVVKQM